MILEQAGLAHYQCHRITRITAKKIAEEFFEESKRRMPDIKMGFTRKQFIAKNWARFVPLARHSLAALLAQASTSQHQKDAIFDALTDDQEIADANLPPALRMPELIIPDSILMN